MTEGQFSTLRALGRVWKATGSTMAKHRLAEAICLAREAGDTWKAISDAVLAAPATAKRYAEASF